MKKLLIILVLLQCHLVSAQSEPKEFNLNRFFLDGAPTVGIYKPIENETTQTLGGYSYTKNSPDYGVGLEFKAGNNWYLKRGKFCGILHLTWIRFGFLFSEGLYAFASPVNIGVGHHFQLNSKVSINTSIHSGALFVVDDVIQVDGFISYFIMPEVKLNINHFTIGFEYAPKRGFSNNDGSVDGHYHYLGLSFGGTFGRIK